MLFRSRLREHFPHYPIKKMRLDIAIEFTSQTFNYCYMSIGIDVEHLIARAASATAPGPKKKENYFAYIKKICIYLK